MQKYICKHSSTCLKNCLHRFPHSSFGCHGSSGYEGKTKDTCEAGYIIEPCIPFSPVFPIKEVEEVKEIWDRAMEGKEHIKEGVGESNIEEVEAILDRLMGKKEFEVGDSKPVNVIEEEPVAVDPILRNSPISKNGMLSWKLSPIQPAPPEADIIIESKSGIQALNKALKTLGWKLERV